MEHVRLQKVLSILVMLVLAISLTLSTPALAAKSSGAELGSKGPGYTAHGEYNQGRGSGEKSCGADKEESAASASASIASKVLGAKMGGRPLSATLSGAEEVPGPGDPDGNGSAFLTFNLGQGMVCWEITAMDIVTATAAHIHEAAMGVAGPVVVTLSPPADGFSSGCASVDPMLIKEIIQNPSGFYVNVHNADYPAGALRGQLSK